MKANSDLPPTLIAAVRALAGDHVPVKQIAFMTNLSPRKVEAIVSVAEADAAEDQKKRPRPRLKRAKSKASSQATTEQRLEGLLRLKKLHRTKSRQKFGTNKKAVAQAGRLRGVKKQPVLNKKATA